MKTGVLQLHQAFGYGGSLSDREVIEEEIRLAELADELDYDALCSVEHHFTDYAFCPDNVVYLAHLAARTKRIKLGTGAVIMPWNTPVRVAEKISMLDALAPGRVIFGMGRGLARREYRGMGIDMDSARERFDESARMVLDALESGFIEGDGPYYPQVRTQIRPRPERTFSDRVFSVAMSADSVQSAAALGTRMTIFTQKPADEVAESFAHYRELFRAAHDREPEPPIVCQLVHCDLDPSRADEGRNYIGNYLTSVVQHYEFAGEHFADTKGYESYSEMAAAFARAGMEAMVDMYCSLQLYGTPEQIIERTHELTEILGPYDLLCAFRYAGIPFAEAERSMRTFAEHVMPTLSGINVPMPV
jgi:alkanesulfonate monooxygenase SsuD/methylene tetrahydromethanopterin reductase-like flavin-dependent oxidoreductase (luciferase family)